MDELQKMKDDVKALSDRLRVRVRKSRENRFAGTPNPPGDDEDDVLEVADQLDVLAMQTTR